MLFSRAALLIGGFLYASRVAAVVTPSQVIININEVTSTSKNINSVVGELNVNVDVQTAQSTALAIGNGFRTIVTSLQNDVSVMAGTARFDPPNARLVVAALNTFVEVHQDLLATLIGKHSILAQFGLTAPIAAVLESLEGIVDTFAFALIDMIPTEKDDVMDGKKALDVSVHNCLTTYSEFCIESLLWPEFPPYCVPSGGL